MKFHHERALALSQQPHARMIDTTVGYKLLEVSRVIFLPMLFCGGYLTCRTDLYQYPAIAKEAFYDFMSLTISDKAIFVYVLVVCTTISTWWATRANPVYCIDFVTYKGPKHLQVTRTRFSEVTGSVANQTEESKRFQMRVYDAGRIGEETTFPESIMAKQPKLNMEGARQEAKDVMCSSVSELFQRTGISPKKIDIVIVNCSLFCPTPSLTAMLVQHFQMRSDILSYNLGGMGCSAGVISIDLAKRLLQNLPKGSHALVVSTENITQNWYHGNQKSMLLSNCLFRQGAAAVLMINFSMICSSNSGGAPTVSLIGMSLSGAFSEGATDFLTRMANIKFPTPISDSTLSHLPARSRWMDWTMRIIQRNVLESIGAAVTSGFRLWKATAPAALHTTLRLTIYFYLYVMMNIIFFYIYAILVI